VGSEPREMSDGYVHVIAKRRLIAGFWSAQAVFVVLFSIVWIFQMAADPARPLGEWRWGQLIKVVTAWDYWLMVALIIGVLMILQTALIWPVRRPRMRAVKGWPVWLSLAVATLAGTTLAAGLALGLVTLAEINPGLNPGWGERMTEWLLVAWCAVSYVVIGTLIFVFCSRRLRRGERHERVLSRIASTIFTGTLIEAAAIMPLDVMYRKRSDCYCGAGTFWAYMLLIGAGLVVGGPAILLPILMKRRKRWYAGRCDCCGYDMRGHVASGREVERCPECGAGWTSDECAAGQTGDRDCV
jgi:hypothetical protein